MQARRYASSQLMDRAPMRALSLLFALAVLWGLPASAAARWYQVEVVVFRQPTGTDIGGETFAPLAALPNFRRAVRLVADLPEMSDEPAPVADEAEAQAPIAFKPIDDDDRRLAGVARRLRGGGYETLLATAWRQPSFGVSRARRVYLSDRDPAITGVLPVSEDGTLATARVPNVEGTVSIKVSRLLHVEIDMLYYRDGTPVRLSETRKVKLRETHYFDHPLFGVVVQVSPYVVPQVEATESVSEEEPLDPGEPVTPAAAAAE